MCCNSLFSFSLKFVGVPKVTHLSWILVFLTNLRHFISSRYSGYNLHFPSFCLIFRNPHLKDSGFTATEYSKHTYIHTHTYTSIITSRSVYMHKTLLFSHSVESDSLWPHWLQHAGLPCPSPSARACSNSQPFSHWCHPTISSSVVPFSSCLQSFPASESFLMSQLFISGGQSTGVSASASVFPMNIQGWFPLELTGFIFLQSKELWRVFFQHHSSKASILWHSVFFMVQLSHPYMTTGKTIALTIRTFIKLWVHNYTSILGIFIALFFFLHF